MSACAMVMDGNDQVVVALNHPTNGIGCPLLHFRVGALDGIQFDSRTMLPGISRRDRSTTHSYSIIFPTQDDDLVSWLRMFFLRLVCFAITDSAGKHDYFVVSQFPCGCQAICFFIVFKSKH